MNIGVGECRCIPSRPFDPTWPVSALLDHCIEMFLSDEGRDPIVVSFVTEIFDLMKPGDRSVSHQFFEMGVADGKQEHFH